MKKSLIYSIASAVIALIAIACTEEADNQGIGNGDGIFRLSSNRRVFTRAAGDEFFAEHTAYKLYAITGTDFTRNYLKNPASAGALEGTEPVNHDYIDGVEANKFAGTTQTLHFYGVTNNTNVSPTITEPVSSGQSPTCHVEYAGEKLPDFMWAKKENQTYQNSGIIILPFEHTLAKLNLYVMKSGKYTNAAVVLNKISLTDYQGADFNILEGKYSQATNGEARIENVVYSGGSQVVTTVAEPVLRVPNDNATHITSLIFPTRKATLSSGDIAGHAVRVRVEGTVGGAAFNKDIPITSILAGGAELPFVFEGNHEYDLVITFADGSLVVVIVPRLYEWISIQDDLTDDEVKSSMTIGGITWMDRNLGATSGDPMAGDQAWENSRGYYYQFGRNIPYYIQTDIDNGIEYALSNGNWHLDESSPFPHVPGKMTDAPISLPLDGASWKSVTGWQDDEGTGVAQYPTETNKKFNFFYYPASSNVFWDYSVNAMSGVNSSLYNNSQRNWVDNANHPCPKGWRIPTKEEFQLVIPSTPQAGDISFRHYRTGSNTFIENVPNDPEVGSTSVYVGVRRNTWTETTVGNVTQAHSIYALKRAGTDNAYFLRWHIEKVEGGREIPNKHTSTSIAERGDPYRNALVISRYPATRNSELTEDNVRTVAEWGHPVEQIKLPFSGYVHFGNSQPALIYSGAEAVYWTSTYTSPPPSGRTGYNTVRMKFSGNIDNREITMYNHENRSNGCLIRCVRDTKAD